MAKKRKPTTKTPSRRSTRRGKQTDENAAAEGESSMSLEPPNAESAATEKLVDSDNIISSDNQAMSEPQPGQSSDSQNAKPGQSLTTLTPAPHKKFGKYRCLFNNDDTFTKRYEVGSDSETNSSIEIRVIDPGVSSESDSNAALDTQSDSNSVICVSPLTLVSNTPQNSSRDMSPVHLVQQEVSVVTEESIIEGIPEAILSTASLSTQNVPEEIMPEEKLDEAAMMDNMKAEDQNVDIPLEEQFVFDDDEVITVVQIVEDDNQEIYYIDDSPKSQDHTDPNISIEDADNKKQETDFQSHFAKLKLSMPIETQGSSSMDYSDVVDLRTPPYGTPDRQYQKENITEGIPRPDPSITPSSTLSDDSNSSRMTEQNLNNSNDSSESSPTGVRRSSRIKTISNMKQKTKGYGLVKTPLKKALITQTKLKLEELSSDSQERPTEFMNNLANTLPFPVPSEMPVKVKSRWRRSSELEMGANSPAISPLASPNLPQRPPALEESPKEEDQPTIPLTKEAYDRIIEERMNQYEHLDENEYLCERMISKETKKMICDCFMTKDELERGERACGEDCLNRLLMIECNSRCPVGERCTNRRFQKKENGPLKVFYADKKGCGIEAAEDIPTGEFLMEYVGEVLDDELFYKRAQAYSDVNNLHHYFMSLKGDTVIDATVKGNISRFINHSCEPNAETQKWTVNGELRIGFFSKRDIVAGEEITFDYQFQRFGKVAQRCYCGADNCRGWIGAEPDSDDEDYEEEEEEEDVSTSKSGVAEASEEERAAHAAAEPARKPRKPRKQRKYKSQAPDLVQDADIEDDLEALSRTGVKNQSHTLRLSRTVVRAKTRRAQAALLRLLRDADLPCRRLFLDYRGLRLLAPWCTDAPLDFKLEMLQTVDRLPIPNKTLVQESRFLNIVERWLSSEVGPPAEPIVLIDEATGLPVELNRASQDAAALEKMKENMAVLEKVKDLSSQLIERWSSLKEVFKIPKKERIQQMKEHERQANIERRAADSSGTRDRDRERREERDRREEREHRDRERERDRDREREREREKDREREREREKERERERERDRYRDRDRERERERERERDDRDRRKRRSSPEGRRSIRLSERVLAAVPPVSKEERRRAFAEAAAAADESRRARERPAWPRPPYWPQEGFAQMFPSGMMNSGQGMMSGGGNMMGAAGMMGAQGMMGGAGNMLPGMMPAVPALMPDVPAEWVGAGGEYQGPPGFCPPFPGAQQFCMPQHNMMGMGGFGLNGYVFGPMGPYSQPPPALPPALQRPPDQAMPASGERGGAEGEAGAPAVLPSQWRSARDARGRTYYYHVKMRQARWTPPTPPPHEAESLSEDEVEQPMSALETAVVKRQAKGKLVEGVNGVYEVIKDEPYCGLIPDHALLGVRPRKRRPGLVTERPISPRTEQDKVAGRLEVKRYRQTKEKLRRRRERLLRRVRGLARRGKDISARELKMADLDESASDTDDSDDDIGGGGGGGDKSLAAASSPRHDSSPPASPAAPVPPAPVPPAPAPAPLPVAAPPPPDPEEAARRIKEQFRSSMARVMVQHLNPYRRSDAPAGRITCTADFKHLARKLTHFVMLKELKHCRTVDELVVTDSVRSKAKMFVKKYMAKFGPVYCRPPEEAD